MRDVLEALGAFALGLVAAAGVQYVLVYRCGLPIEQAGGLATATFLTTGLMFLNRKQLLKGGRNDA